ncbi:MAG: hypothetical protein NTU41_08320, partial [Chloroflexi bacterium]|nr:hypothetical protein [Chloroflexota bacterium]
FPPPIIVRNAGSDPPFADELTDLSLTLDGFRMIGAKLREVAKEVCGGRTVDLLGSGYNQTVLPLGWLSLIADIAGLDDRLKEPFPFPSIKSHGIEEARRTVAEAKDHLKPYWRCFEFWPWMWGEARSPQHWYPPKARSSTRSQPPLWPKRV